jgi:hypothetical protein
MLASTNNIFKPELNRIIKELGSNILPEKKEKIGLEL